MIVPVYTSELMFFFHPFIFTDSSHVTIILFVSRLLLNVAAITLLVWVDSLVSMIVVLALLLASAFLWIVTAIQEPTTPDWLEKAAYISIVNWSVDLPGISMLMAGKPISRIPTIVILILNVVAGGILAFVELAVTPIRNAWGCYPPGSSLRDLKYGVCPKFHDHTEPTPVCDQPGVTCFYTDDPQPFESYHAISSNIVGVSIAIYLAALRSRSVNFFD